MPETRKSSSGTLFWFRQDLRLDDQPALLAAAEKSEPVIPVFLWPLNERIAWPMGDAGKSWLYHSLRSLQAILKQRGSCLVLRRGQVSATLSAAGLQLGLDSPVPVILHVQGWKQALSACP
jgi:deoxyribodipyrimidine photo-lyase